MGRRTPVSMRAMFRIAMLVGAALVLAACGGSETSGSTADPTGSTATAASIQDQSTDPCSGPLPTDGFALDAVAEIPTLDDDGNPSTLGTDEAAAILDEFLDPELSICALDLSPGVQAAIDAVRVAADQGDLSEVRRLLEQLIRVDIQAAAAPIKSLRSFYAPEDRQKSRDALAAAAEAQARGQDDLAEEAIEQALEHYTNYAATAIPASNDWRALLVIAAEAQMLGLNDIADEAIEKATEILEMELKEVADRYDPCDPTREEFRELTIATGRVQMIGGDSSDGDELISKTIDISIRRANGEPVPECDDQWSLGMTMDVDTGQGFVTFLWDGVFAITEEKIEGDGIGTLIGTGECVVNNATVQVFDVTGTFTFTVSGSRSVTGSAERLNLQVKSTEADVELDASGSDCAGLAEIASAFLSSVSTYPALYYPQGFDIQVTNGNGSSDVTIEPYLLEVTVSLLGE